MSPSFRDRPDRPTTNQDVTTTVRTERSAQPMRILHVNKFLYRKGGAEAYVLDVADAQGQRGHEIAFFGMDHPDNPPLEYDAWFPDHVELEPAPRSPLGKIRATARMLWSTSSSDGIGAVVERFRPDVAHLHNVYHQLSPSILWALRRRAVPTVMTLHDYKLVCPSYQLLAGGSICERCVGTSFRHAVTTRCKDGSLGASLTLAVESTVHRAFNAYGHASILICPSRFLAERMLTAGFAAERVRVLDHFIERIEIDAPTLTRTSNRATGPSGGPIVFAGRIAREKGVDVLIDAIAEAGPSARLVIAGDGPLRAELEDRAARRAPGQVRWLGRLDRAEVHEVIRSASAVAVPSVWHENQPLIVLEAFACGVPVIATTLGGLPDLVEDGVTGLLVPPNDPVELARAIAAVLKDPERSQRMGAQAAMLARERFARDRHLDALDDIYATALAANSTSA
jgi:glycosyltransferase involved in cell wall biosynthesis